MAKAYSVEIRERAVAAVLVEGLSQPAAARLFGLGVATLERWLFLWRSGQELAARQAPRPGPAPHLDGVALEQLRLQVKAQPDARLSDHVRTWQEARGQALSETTLWRGLRALGWTRKKALRQRRARRGRTGRLASCARGLRPEPTRERG